MATITADGQSLMIDGQRVWLAAGTIPYARVPRELWARRIADARDAGLNCIETPVIWGLHEPRPGVFDFDGELDLSAFIELVGEAQMHVMLRLGPYIGPGWDLGGIPAWLIPEAPRGLRSSATEFLTACARYYGVLCAHIRDLQISVSRRRKTGPIIMVQSEHHWFCGDPVEGSAYLGELDRYLRENGITVPIVNTNNLFHHVEGQISAWASGSHFHSTVRQLRAVAADHPAFSIVPASTVRAIWGEKWGSAPPAGSIMRALAEVLAGGGQYVLTPFHAGTFFEFSGGRYAHAQSAFATSDPEPDAPLDSAGQRTTRYHEVRRISLLASHFGRVLANLDPEYRPAVVSLEPPAQPAQRKAARGSITAVDCRGSQGSIIFVFAPLEGGASGSSITLTLDDGSTLPVTLSEDPVSWVLRDVHLAGRARLDYCNLSVVALVGEVLVCYGPAGAPGLLSINGSTFEVEVPTGDAPQIERHEGMTLVICNESSIDCVAVGRESIFLGAGRIDADGAPVLAPGAQSIVRFSSNGEQDEVEAASEVVRKGSVPFGAWSLADTGEYVRGGADRFAKINGPMTMEQLGVPRGYGWLRLELRSSSARKVKAGLFESGDRLHVYDEGDAIGIVGEGPGAVGPIIELSLKKGDQTLSMLIDNLGRQSEGVAMGEAKGLYGPIWSVTALRIGAAKMETGAPICPLEFRTPIFGLERQDRTDPRRLTWSITHRKKTPIIMVIDADVGAGVVLVNDEVVHVLQPGGSDRLVLDVVHQLKRGVNSIQIALVGPMTEAAGKLKKAVNFYEGVENLSEKATWAFAKWEQPGASRYEVIPKSKMTTSALAKHKGEPVWWRGEFTPKHEGGRLFLDAKGLSKGQLFLNGRNLGRYFVATASGKAVPPQSRYILPAPWLTIGAANELVIFDEHGFGPAGCKLVYDPKSS